MHVGGGKWLGKTDQSMCAAPEFCGVGAGGSRGFGWRAEVCEAEQWGAAVAAEGPASAVRSKTRPPSHIQVGRSSPLNVGIAGL